MTIGLNQLNLNNSTPRFSQRDCTYSANIEYCETNSFDKLDYNGVLNINKSSIEVNSSLGETISHPSIYSKIIKQNATSSSITLAKFCNRLSSLNNVKSFWELAVIGAGIKDINNDSVFTKLRFSLPTVKTFTGSGIFVFDDCNAAQRAAMESEEMLYTFSLNDGFKLDLNRALFFDGVTSHEEVFFTLNRTQKKFSLKEANRVAIYPLQEMLSLISRKDIKAFLLSGVIDGSECPIYDYRSKVQEYSPKVCLKDSFGWLEVYLKEYKKNKRSIFLIKQSVVIDNNLITGLSSLISEVQPATRILNIPQRKNNNKPLTFTQLLSELYTQAKPEGYIVESNWANRIKHHRDYFQHGDESNVDLANTEPDEALALRYLLTWILLKTIFTKYINTKDSNRIWLLIVDSSKYKADLKEYNNKKAHIKSK